MTHEDKKQQIARELDAMEHSGVSASERLARLRRVGDLYYSIGQFQEAQEKLREFREEGVAAGRLSPTEAATLHLQEIWCFYERGDYDGVERRLSDLVPALSGLPENDAAALLAEKNVLNGYLSIRRGRYEDALKYCDQAFTTLQNTDDHAALAKVHILYGHGYFRSGDLTRAREFYEDGLASARRAADPIRLVQANINLALVCKELGDTRRALYLLEQANEILKNSGIYLYRGHVMLNMAVIQTHRGQLQLADESYRNALRIYQQTGQQNGAVLARIGIARVHMLRGALSEARVLMTETLATCQEHGYLREEVLLRRDLADLERSTGSASQALTLYHAALSIAEPLGKTSEHVVQIGRRIGLTHLRLGDYDAAEAALREALLVGRKIGERYEEAILLCALGAVSAHAEKWDEFESLFQQGLEMLRRMGERIERAKALVRRVRLRPQGRMELAESQLELTEARRVFLEAGVPDWVGKTRLEEARIYCEAGDMAKGEQSMGLAEKQFLETGNSRLLGQVETLRRSIEASIVERAVSKRNDHLAIHDILPASATTFDLKGLLADLVGRTGSDRGILLFREEDEGAFVERAVRGLRQREAGNIRNVLASIFESAFDARIPFLTMSAGNDPRLPARVPDGTLPVRSLLIVPFRTETDVSGIIYLDRFENRDPFGSRELDLVVGLVRSERFFLSLLASRQRELVEENSRLRMQVSQGHFDEIVTQSERMYEVLDLVRKVASTNVTVLIQGETGTGKQLITRAVHGESPRRERTLYSINCATLPEQLLESELFGHISGSFTGANRDKTGLLMEASGSSVFLDEIDKMKIGVQSKLLTVLEEKRIRPIGSNEYFDVDVRFICASNRDLKQEVEEGRFLEDLYYRLNTIKIDLPPLRDRVEDILLLGQYFLRIFSAEMGKEAPRINERASQALLQFSWPGNVRELRSEMRRVIVLHDGGPITVSSFSPAITNFTASQAKRHEEVAAPGEGPLKEQVDRFERQLLEQYLKEHGGNVSSMARDLGISRWGLHKKLERHGLR